MIPFFLKALSPHLTQTYDRRKLEVKGYEREVAADSRILPSSETSTGAASSPSSSSSPSSIKFLPTYPLIKINLFPIPNYAARCLFVMRKACSLILSYEKCTVP